MLRKQSGTRKLELRPKLSFARSRALRSHIIDNIICINKPQMTQIFTD